MPTEPEKNGLLSSWKEIAAILGVDERTCARWEKSLGLPVRRITGANRSRIFAYRPEIEAWARARLVAAKESETGRAARLNRRARLVRLAAVLGGSALLMGVALGLAARNPLLRFWMDREPVSIAVHGATLDVLNKDGIVLMAKDFGRPLGSYSDVFAFFYVPGSETQELLWSFAPATQQAPASVLLCLTLRGRELWRFTPGRTLHSARMNFSPDYLIRAIHPFDEPDAGGTRIAVLSTHSPWEPCQLALLDASGAMVGEYWNNGHFRPPIFIREDFDGDGVKEILLAGENNAFDRACLAVLDPRRIDGSSPQSGAPDHALAGLTPGRAEPYLVFPKSILCEEMEVRNRVTDVVLLPAERAIEVTVLEYHDERNYALKYSIDYAFQNVTVTPEGEFSAKIKELQGLGRLGRFDEADMLRSLSRRVESWIGETMIYLRGEGADRK